MKSLLKADLAAKGVLVETQDGYAVNTDVVVIPPPVVEQPAQQIGRSLKRAVRIGATVTLLEADSVHGLDVLEAALRTGQI